MAKAKKEFAVSFVPPQDPYIYFYVGDKYYRRMQPTPYVHQRIDFKEIKKILSN